MAKLRYLLLLIAVVGCATLVTAIDKNYLFNSNRFPEPEAVPTLSNGNLGFTVFSDSVYLTGVYNGRLEQSHRARIPNYGHFQLSQCSRPESNPPHCTYQLDIKHGRFQTIYDDPNQQMRIVHSVYPHRYFSQTLVNYFRIERLSGNAVQNANIQYVVPDPSDDIAFQPAQSVIIQNEIIRYQCGRTTVVEDAVLQPQGTEVCIYYKDYPTVLELPADRDVKEYTLYTVFSKSKTAGENEMKHLALTDVEILQQTHESMMTEMWNQYGVTVDGNDELDRAIKASAFQLFSNVPTLYTPQATSTWGISPAGIGRGGALNEGFQGHNLWHFDMWIFPIILMVDDHLVTQQFLEYRTKTTRGVLAENARQEYYEGWKYPWASAFTGLEVSSSQDLTRYQQHVTGDVLFAVRQYLLATDNLSWMLTEGCELAYETARFWKHRSVYSPTLDKYGIYMATGPDDTHLFKNNNAYTNGVAAHNLFLGEYAGCLCRSDLSLEEEQWRDLTKVAKSLHLVYDDVSDFTPQFEGYTEGTPVSQADAVLIGYPLELPLADSTKRHNLEIYSKATIANTSAMTWSMHAISWLDLDEMDRAAEDLRKSYQPYMRPPFNVWNERPVGYAGATNFVTGAGGFLQTILNGYAGIRYRIDEMVIRPRLPPGATRMLIPEINYMRGKFSLEIHSNGTFALTAKPVVTNPSLKIFVDNQELEMCSPRDTCHYFGSFNATLKVLRMEPPLNGCTLQPTTLNQLVSASSTVKPVLYLVLLLGCLLKYSL